MLKYKKTQQRLPIGGHHFHDHGVTFKADSFESLCEKIKEFRINNAIREGDPEQEVLLFYAKNFPYVVESDDTIPRVKDTQDADKWIEYVTTTWRNPPRKLLTSKEASIRWDACKTCKYNKRLEKDSSREIAETEKRAFMLRRGVDVPHELGYCSLFGIDTRIASFIEDTKSSIESGDKPAGCWVQQSKD